MQVQRLNPMNARLTLFMVEQHSSTGAASRSLYIGGNSRLPSICVYKVRMSVMLRRLGRPSRVSAYNQLVYSTTTSNSSSKANEGSPPLSSAPPADAAVMKTNVSWIEHKMIPMKVRPYLHLARVDKQVGTMLLLWPCVWSVALATPMGQLPSLLLLSKFAFGSFVMRGAGCTINDLWDRDFDKHVERTKARPLAAGDITVPQALGFLCAQLSCGLGVLLSLNAESIVLGMASMPLVVCYPLMKRFTNWPQLVLGLTFNWGALVGWTAATGSKMSILTAVREGMTASSTWAGAAETLVATAVTAASNLPAGLLDHALPLYAAGVCWTLVYDTLYGYQDRKDDKTIGVKSTALYLGDKPQLPLSALSVGMLGGLCLAGNAAALSAPFYVGAAAMWGHSLWQIWTADINDSKNLWTRFNSNKYSGGVLALSIVAGHF